MREGFEPGRAVFGLVDVARAKAVQQGADNAPHVGIVVDHEETQAVEIDPNHSASRDRECPGPQRRKVASASLRNRLG